MKIEFFVPSNTHQNCSDKSLITTFCSQVSKPYKKSDKDCCRILGNNITSNYRKCQNSVKGCVRYTLPVCFVRLKESTCKTRKNVFCFTLKALFVLEIIKFSVFRYSNIMMSSNA